MCGHYGTSFINYPVQNRGERGWLPTCGPYSAGPTRRGPPGWLEESDLAGVIFYVMDGPYRLLVGYVVIVQYVFPLALPIVHKYPR